MDKEAIQTYYGSRVAEREDVYLKNDPVLLSMTRLGMEVVDTSGNGSWVLTSAGNEIIMAETNGYRKGEEMKK